MPSDVCQTAHASHASAMGLCTRIMSVLPPCSIRRIDARSPDAWDLFLQHAWSGNPLILTNARPSTLLHDGSGLEHLLQNRIRRQAQVGAAYASVTGHKLRAPISLAKYLKQMHATQQAVLDAEEKAQPTPPHDRLRYLFPGEPIKLLFDNFTASFGDTRVVVGGAVRYDHGRSGLSTFAVNGAFVGLPYHHHTSSLHELVHGAKHFMFFTSPHRAPPFGIRSKHEKTDPAYHATVHDWLSRRGAPGVRARLDAHGGATIGYGSGVGGGDDGDEPDAECTAVAGDIVFVPYNITHATYNLAATASLSRDGCSGLIPSLLPEHFNPKQCPGPEPPPGHGPWRATDFIEPPPEDMAAGRHLPDVVLYPTPQQMAGTKANADLRIKLIVFADGRTEQGAAALRHAQARAANEKAEPYIWAHVPCHPENGFCGLGGLPKLMVDGRSIGVFREDGMPVDLGSATPPGVDRRLNRFLEKHRQQLDELRARLMTLS